jgi:hypothetical protein
MGQGSERRATYAPNPIREGRRTLQPPQRRRPRFHRRGDRVRGEGGSAKRTPQVSDTGRAGKRAREAARWGLVVSARRVYSKLGRAVYIHWWAEFRYEAQ